MKFPQNRAVRNAGWLIGGRLVQLLAGLLVGLLSARYLGPSGYGLIGYAGAYTAFFASICSLGLNAVLVKEFIDCPGQEGVILGTALGLRGGASLLSAAAIIGISLAVDRGDQTAILVVALSACGMVLHIVESFNYWFQSRLESKVTALAALAAYLVSAAYKLYLMAAGKGVVCFALVTAVDGLCLGVVLYIQYRRRDGGRLIFSVSWGRALLRKSAHFILPGLMVSVYGQTDKLMLKQMAGESELGCYSAAVTLCGMWCFVLTAIIDSASPGIMEANGRDEALFRRKNVRLYALVFHLSAAVSLAMTVLAGPLVALLYGKAYLPAAAPARIAAWYTAFSYLGVARSAWIVCKNRQSCLLPVYCAAAAANVLLNCLLIPRYGACGAAAASLMAQITSTLAAPLLIGPLRENAALMAEGILLKGILWGGRNKGG